MKVGIIRCQQMEDLCQGTTDFKNASQGKGVFEKTGPVEIVGFVSCGGCPGKKAIARAQTMVQRGAEAIFFASCMGRGLPYEFPCPNFDRIVKATRKKLGESIQVFDWTH